MVRFHLSLAVMVLTAGLCAAAARGEAWYDDVTFELSSMSIDGVILGGREMEPRFDRDQLSILAGTGRATFGLIYQATDKAAGIGPGEPDRGLMLVGGYDHILSTSWRLDLTGRVGVTGSDEYQPLYSEDTDVRAKLVWFDGDGLGVIGGQPIFPSGYVGAIVNRHGRVQALGGVGSWWKGLGLYATAFYAVNGDDPRFNGTDFGRVNFANLENAGYSVTLSYEWQTLQLKLKRNFPLRNGSDDLTFGIGFRHYPGRTVAR